MDALNDVELKDPFNGPTKAFLVGLTYFLQLVPFLSYVPFFLAFFYTVGAFSDPGNENDDRLAYQIPVIGLLMIASIHFGSAIIGRLLFGFSELITAKNSKTGFPPRMTITLGIILQIPLYALILETAYTLGPMDVL